MKILVVEDSLENIELAKKYVADDHEFTEGYEFIYVTNRKDAEKLLHTVDGVITDRSIPYDAASTYECEVNGYYIAALAINLKKPFIMMTSHGDSLGIGIKTDNLIGLEEELIRFSRVVNPMYESPEAHRFRKYYYKWISISWKDGYTKLQLTSWMIVWTKLKQQL